MKSHVRLKLWVLLFLGKIFGKQNGAPMQNELHESSLIFTILCSEGGRFHLTCTFNFVRKKIISDEERGLLQKSSFFQRVCPRDCFLASSCLCQGESEMKKSQVFEQIEIATKNW